jgi:carbon-monoxide dehydrogenase large subunit
MTVRRNTFIGQRLPRVEDRRLVTGRGQFVDDLHKDGLLHAAILRSTVPHGRITSIDTSVARALSGVHGIITALDVGTKIPVIPIRMAPLEGQERFQQPVIAATKVRYVGEPVAVVLAESRALAEDALDLIKVEIVSLAPVVSPIEMPAPALLFEEHATNMCAAYSVSIGDATTAFSQADYTRCEDFKVHRHTALPMETRGLVAAWDERKSQLVVWGAAKVPYFNRRTVASMLELPEAAVELIELDVGGGFGVRGEFYPEDFLIPFAARWCGRPVKWIEDRHEHLMATNHSRDVTCSLEIACRRDGTIIGLRGALIADMGAYIRTTGGVIPARAAQFLPGPYRIPNVEVKVEAALTNKTPSGSFRGPGRYEANFFRERLMDIAARDLGIDAIEFRRRNLITTSEMPYNYGRLVPYDTPTVYDSGDYHLTLERCLVEIGWKEKVHLQGQLVEGRYHGLGVGCFVESGGSGKENARIRLTSDRTVTVAVGSSALGQGIETAFTQIAADALGLPVDRIRVEHGSTTRLEQGFGSFHGRSMVMGGPAVFDAAEKLIEKLRSAAAARFGCRAEEINLAEGILIAPDGRSADFWTFSSDEQPLFADGHYATLERVYSYGSQCAHVAVDPATGKVDVLDYVTVEDAGRIINPMIVEGQKIGAVVQGLGGTLLEHLTYDDEGQLLSVSLADYLLPTATDFPSVRAISLENSPSPHNPLGLKGAGEDGIISVGAVIANAVGAALAPLGCAPNVLPLSPSKIRMLIREAESRSLETDPII